MLQAEERVAHTKVNREREISELMKTALKFLAFFGLVIGAASTAAAQVERFGVFEAEFQAQGQHTNAYTELEAEAKLKLPDGSKRKLPLFWDGGQTWRLRVSPSIEGTWGFKVKSRDEGLNGKSGSFECVSSSRRGSIQPMKGHPLHFQYQNGEKMWFMGDTAWALCTDNEKEKHDPAGAEKYLRERARQGFNVVHTMLLSEAGWGNPGGFPFTEISAEKLNPAYFKEVDERVAFANREGLVVGLAVAWGDKRKVEPFAWRRFPNVEARKRYARYIAARYGAYDVYFIVSGEWHGEIYTRGSTEAEIKKEFVEIGNALHEGDAHERMMAIHPMIEHGSVREFNEARWMDFGDYQQNYDDLHRRLLESRSLNKPVVNSEYGYYLRDQNGDGVPDKENSTSLEVMRHATWDIAMAGGYVVTGFGTTYFGGNRDPGPFDLEAEKNNDWEAQMGFLKRCFTGLRWWELKPQDEWLTCATARTGDRRFLERPAPPLTTYWLLANAGQEYVAYARGVSDEIVVKLGPGAEGEYDAEVFDPRTGELRKTGGKQRLAERYQWTPPDKQDWVLLLRRRLARAETAR